MNGERSASLEKKTYEIACKVQGQRLADVGNASAVLALLATSRNCVGIITAKDERAIATAFLETHITHTSHQKNVLLLLV